MALSELELIRIIQFHTALDFSEAEDCYHAALFEMYDTINCPEEAKYKKLQDVLDDYFYGEVTFQVMHDGCIALVEYIDQIEFEDWE